MAKVSARPVTRRAVLAATAGVARAAALTGDGLGGCPRARSRCSGNSPPTSGSAASSDAAGPRPRRNRPRSGR